MNPRLRPEPDSFNLRWRGVVEALSPSETRRRELSSPYSVLQASLAPAGFDEFGCDGCRSGQQSER